MSERKTKEIFRLSYHSIFEKATIRQVNFLHSVLVYNEQGSLTIDNSAIARLKKKDRRGTYVGIIALLEVSLRIHGDYDIQIL